jgi:hypothetical protein
MASKNTIQYKPPTLKWVPKTKDRRDKLPISTTFALGHHLRPVHRVMCRRLICGSRLASDLGVYGGQTPRHPHLLLVDDQELVAVEALGEGHHQCTTGKEFALGQQGCHKGTLECVCLWACVCDMQLYMHTHIYTGTLTSKQVLLQKTISASEKSTVLKSLHTNSICCCTSHTCVMYVMV